MWLSPSRRCAACSWRFAAEAFHWFDGDRALTEIALVLRPRGARVMWNLPAGPTEPSIVAVEQLLDERVPNRDELGYDPLDLNSSRYASGEWRHALAASPFEEIRRRGCRIRKRSTGTAWWRSSPDGLDRRPSRRGPAALLHEVRSLLDSAEYRRPWETHVYWTRLATRLPDALS